MKKKIIFTGSLLLVVTLFSFTPPAERYFEIAKNLDIFASLFKEVNSMYVDEVNPNKLMRTGIDAMLNSLDPYTNYYSEDEIEDFNTMNTGQYGGIGAVTREIGKRVVVTLVYDGYPAQRSGLKIGDELVKMNGIELSRLSQDEANHLLKGQVGTTVKLSVKRMGADDLIELEFKREKVKMNNVPYSGMVTPDVGYIQLTEFTSEVGKEVKNGLLALKEKGAKSVIIDLRENPGGMLIEAVNICNIFLPKEVGVVVTKGRPGSNNTNYLTLNPPVDAEIPLAILINRGSASASEIVAGTIQDYDRGLIIGEKSFGKGLVQAPKELTYHAHVKITTAKYYTPTGRCIQVLDYSHRRDDGSVGSIPDSLKKEFKTTHGRSVYDGGGIDPDIHVDSYESPTIAQVLFLNGLLFDYATLYTFKHPVIAPAREFSLTEDEYKEFMTWVKTKDYSYRSKVEMQLNMLTEAVKKEHYLEELKPQLESIQTKVSEGRKGDLVKFKDQIKSMLEQEIVTHHYFEKGAIESGFKNDDGLKKAIELLNDQAKYKKILHIQ